MLDMLRNDRLIFDALRFQKIIFFDQASLTFQ
jgi:hypothetical protein